MFVISPHTNGCLNIATTLKITFWPLLVIFGKIDHSHIKHLFQNNQWNSGDYVQDVVVGFMSAEGFVHRGFSES